MPSKLKASFHDRLQVHPDFDWYNGDLGYLYVETEEGEDIWYFMMNYVPDLGAFVLLYFTDDSYTDVVLEATEEGGKQPKIELLAEVGLEGLEHHDFEDEDDDEDGDDEG